MNSRLLGRALFLVFALGLLFFGGTAAYFQSWRLDTLSSLDASSEVAQTDAGNIEYVAQGDGPAVLVFHGAPGGFDQAMLFGSGLLDEKYQIIAPSRPGYLRTPLSIGQSPSQQADAMASLLDDLGVTSVAVLGVSAGSPAALEFAARHPERVWALVLVSAAYAGGPDVAAGLEHSGLFDSSDIGSWMRLELANTDVSRVLASLSSRGDSASPEKRSEWMRFVCGDSAQVDWFRAFIGTLAPADVRKAGYRNDVAQLAAWKPLPMNRIKAPTLIVHGTTDKVFPFADAKNAAAAIGNCRLIPVEDAGHLVLLGPAAKDLRAQVSQFLGQFHGGQSQP